MPHQLRLVLASSSPRRLQLLDQIGVVPDAVDAPSIDESPRRAELPRDYALRMAQEKAAAVAPRHAGALVLACDTVVAVGRRILPRADCADQVAACLKLLSGRRHRVISAVVLICPEGRAQSRIAVSDVRFTRLEDRAITAYVASGEGIGKAGGYAIQGRAAAMIAWMAGSYSGIVGLPLHETRALLGGAGYHGV